MVLNTLFPRNFEYTDEGRALTSGDFQNMLMNAKMTVTYLNGTPTARVNPVSDALIIGSNNYTYFDTFGAWQEVSIVFDCYTKRHFKSIIFSTGVINQVQDMTLFTTTIYGSNDNSNWDVLDTATGTYTGATNIYRDLSSGDVKYRYLKFYSRNEQASSSSSSGVHFFLMQANI